MSEESPATIVIAGGGIVGLVLAMKIQKELGVTPEVYDKAHAFADDVGAGLGMYPNGLRVLRDISPGLLKSVVAAGYPYEVRRWERHDGTPVAEADESVLQDGDESLKSIGIRRWKLQKALYDFALAMGIEVHFNKGASGAEQLEEGLVRVDFEDGTSRLTRMLFGCDGGHSKIREVVAGNESKLVYTGVTCLMGIAECDAEKKGISFPSSNRDVHAVFFPTGPNEQCFQFHFPIEEKDADRMNWGNLSQSVGQQDCKLLAEKLRKEGWHERFLEPLENVQHAVRVGFALLEPKLGRWVKGRIALCGDAAHPPVPYIGQGAQQGMEDVGVAVAMLKHCCCKSGTFDLTNFDRAMTIYEEIRKERSSKILQFSKELGGLQASRAGTGNAITEAESLLLGDVLLNGTLPIMYDGADHDYKKDAEEGVRRAEGKEEHEPISLEECMDALEYLFCGKQDAITKQSHYSRVTPAEARAAFEALFCS